METLERGGARFIEGRVRRRKRKNTRLWEQRVQQRDDVAGLISQLWDKVEERLRF